MTPIQQLKATLRGHVVTYDTYMTKGERTASHITAIEELESSVAKLQKSLFDAQNALVWFYENNIAVKQSPPKDVDLALFFAKIATGRIKDAEFRVDDGSWISGPCPSYNGPTIPKETQSTQPLIGGVCHCDKCGFVHHHHGPCIKGNEIWHAEGPPPVLDILKYQNDTKVATGNTNVVKITHVCGECAKHMVTCPEPTPLGFQTYCPHDDEPACDRFEPKDK